MKIAPAFIAAFAPAVASVIASLAVAGPAHAQPQVAVPYGDLNFNNPEAAGRLDARLQRAVHSVCRPMTRALYDIVASQECERAALARARETAARMQDTMLAERKGNRPGR